MIPAKTGTLVAVGPVAPGSASDVADANGSVYARLKWWKDRADDDADEIQRLRDALRAIAYESLHHGEYNPISKKTLLPQGYQKIHRMAMSALPNVKGTHAENSHE